MIQVFDGLSESFALLQLERGSSFAEYRQYGLYWSYVVRQ